MNYDQFKNLSCHEEFEMRSDLMGISKINILRKIGYKIKKYYFFISGDGIFNWFDLKGNHVEDPAVLTTIKEEYIPKNITKCIIPNSVMHIDIAAFSFCELLKEIIIPNSVTDIGDDVFWFCESLKEITIPNSVTDIGEGIFNNCTSLNKIIISNSIKHIEHDTFFQCASLQNVIIPNSIMSIGKGAFAECKSLKKLVIPNNVKRICANTFIHCNSLKEIIFKGKTLEEVKQMKSYPFGIKDESIIKVSKT